MKFHLFNFKPNGIIRVLWHLSAGFRLCSLSPLLLKKFIPESINSMTTANNFAEVMRGKEPPLTLLDVGANVSQMTRLLKMVIPEQVRILSFEPNPELQPIGKVFRVALGNTNGPAEFFVPADSTWGTTIQEKVVKEKPRVLQVNIRRFEDMLASGEISEEELSHPILLKVDTEGAEFQTLQGFGGFLSEIDYVLVELTNPAEGTGDMLKIHDLLKSNGFDCSKVLYAGHHGSSAPDYLDVFFWKSSKVKTS